MINILEKVSNKSDLCYISSKTKYSLGLSYVIKYNEKFLRLLILVIMSMTDT